jgi:hypothetical protein
LEQGPPRPPLAPSMRATGHSHPLPRDNILFPSVTIRSSSPIVAFRRGAAKATLVRDGSCDPVLFSSGENYGSSWIIPTYCSRAVSARASTAQAQHKRVVVREEEDGDEDVDGETRRAVVLAREQNPWDCEQAQKEIRMQQVLRSVLYFFLFFWP